MRHGEISLDHLERMSDHRGLFEHAEGIDRRIEHGYCTDDNARLLVVTSRKPDVGVAHRLSLLALQFVCSAQSPDGRTRNRMAYGGQWTDQPTTEDCWGRSLWGLGVAATQHSLPTVRVRAFRAFELGARQRSQYPRAMAFAALGAAEVAAADPQHTGARGILEALLDMVGPVAAGPWGWPEPTLRYANAALAEAVIAAGSVLGRADVVDKGLGMLGWLLDLETRDNHLSVTGVGGRQPGDHSVQFDQQPIEVAALADACWRAAQVSDDPRWPRGIEMAAAWFMGDNDIGVAVYDWASGGGYDGLMVDGVNLNQGAESTLALIATMQRAREFARTP
ncbi:MAG: glycosyltransferase [Actinomycetota bacterium]|nr:glycosyltransferase [Actinomycetota bacterium]